MLVKEYRIPLPMTVDEYKIAQLYMIAKKSREESKGTESGVEILLNEPYNDGPGGSGQYTHKIYHVGSHLPAWFKSLLPKSALTVEEEAWNAYPYTKTRFKCPFVEKFSLEIETYYLPDAGGQANVFKLSKSELNNRVVDLIDVVKDEDATVYEDSSEDPTRFVSSKTGRGPLSDEWLSDYWKAIEGNADGVCQKSGKAIMCAYKLCKVEFRYWGMQSKIERFIHDVALRKTMLKAHLQAWLWQDEWHGLTMDDIRAIEKETAELLKRTMRGEGADDVGDVDSDIDEDEEAEDKDEDDKDNEKTMIATNEAINDSNRVSNSVNTNSSSPIDEGVRATFSSIEYAEQEAPNIIPKGTEKMPRRPMVSKLSEELEASQLGRSRSVNPSLMNTASMMRTSVDTNEESEDEFFDCRDTFDDTVSLAKWSSMELTPIDDNDNNNGDEKYINTNSSKIVSFRRVQSMKESNTTIRANYDRPPLSASARLMRGDVSVESSGGCPTSVLLLVAHGGSVLDGCLDPSVRKSDVTTFRGAFESIMRTHYPALLGRIVIRCVSCNAVCKDALALLSRLSPYSFDAVRLDDDNVVSNDHLPVNAIPLLATANKEAYMRLVHNFVREANGVYKDFLNSEEGREFRGQVCFVGDSVGGVVLYDALINHGMSRAHSNDNCGNDSVQAVHSQGPLLSAPPLTPQHPSDSFFGNSCLELEFEVSEFFTFGCPLAVVLAHRLLQQSRSTESGLSSPHRSHWTTSRHPWPSRPQVHQMYNLFHHSDPLASRLEPLLHTTFAHVPPINVARYQKYPMGDGVSLSLIEFVQANPALFALNNENMENSRPNTPGDRRRASEESIQSGMLDAHQLQIISALKSRWWGNRRLDYALYCPDGLTNFPTNALPHLFHSSYWESADVISFILRQLARTDPALFYPSSDVRLYASELGSMMSSTLVPPLASTALESREKWLKKRTSVKIRNGAPNHRGNDVIVREGKAQTVVGRFNYGPFDMGTLTGERVDILLMKEPPMGEWSLLATYLTDKTGRVAHTLEESMAYGVYPVRMVVRGDQTMLNMYLAVVPDKTESVVFSIDGSFAASVSVTGKDPKVKAGAVDVVRHWQELGYLIIYVTGRPDMQLQKVVYWLSQHNFPHGLVSFADGFSTDPLGHKADCLKSLMRDQGIVIHAAYGSNKDVSVYSSLGLKASSIFIVGKVSRKYQQQATALSDGYVSHLARLSAKGGSRPAQGNARMVIPKFNFGLNSASNALTRRSTVRAKRTTSFPYKNRENVNNEMLNN